ncbi:MAG TPA: MFS transporter [Actinospica sp.]|jgi:DHA2 family methylenomycin A resistance protein-like MFS transporter|nr:MFS transporter [Actinospica sp.]
MAPRKSPVTVLVVMCSGYFLVLLDVTIVNVALPSIGTGLHANVSALQWVVDGYAIALASLMLPSGTIGDRFGHKRIVLTGLTVFGVSSLACGLAPNAPTLVAARAVQGVGAALLLPGTLAIISRAYPERQAQARAIGVWAGIGGLALPAGPVVGGALIAGFNWRAVFLVNVPVVILALVASMVIVPDDRGRRDEDTPEVDGLGTLLGVLLLVATTFAVIQAGRSGADAASIGAGAAAVLLLAAFVAVERRRGDRAMLPPSLARRPAFSIANTAAGVMNLGTLGVLFVLSLFLQQVQHRSPLGAGLALMPLFIPLAVIAPLGGRLTGRIGTKLPMVAGLVIAASGLAALALTDRDASYPALLLPSLLAWGIGLGILVTAVVAAAVAAVPAERSGLASAVNNTARQTGGAIGIALTGALAGQPDAPRFLPGLHASALGAAALYTLTAALALLAPASAKK